MLRPLQRALLLAAVIALAACGAGHLIKKGDALLKQGRHDAAIQHYEEAVRAAKGDPVATAKATKALRDARAVAAQQHIARGDNLRDKRHLREAGQAYKTAAAYMPTNQDVVQRQAELLKQRLRIEQDIDTVNKDLALLLPRGHDAKDVGKWVELARLSEGLLAWRHDYPQVVALHDKVARPAAEVLLKDAQRAIAVEDFDHAQFQIQRALRLQPNHERARELLDAAAVKGNADKLAKKGNKMLESGDAAGAVGAYEEALKKDPNSYAAKQGVREARRRYVESRLATIDKHLKKRQHKQALIAVIEAHAMGTDYPKLAKQLQKRHAAVTARAAKHFYQLGRKHEKKRLWGAALIAFRTAAQLGDGGKDTGKRIEKAQRLVADQRALKLYTATPKVPKDGFAPAADTLMQQLRAAIQASNLPARGVTLVEDRRQRKATEGQLVMAIKGFSIRRTQRPDDRRKKYLDRVEFPDNPRWAVAQSELSAALAAMNAATDELRPVQEHLNAAEERLAKLDAEYVKLKERIRQEDAAHYQNKAAPCPNGTTDCPESHANKRWAKHVAYYRDQISKTNGKIATLSPEYQKLRDKVQRLTKGFHDAERAAHETPKKLREEIWLDYNYTVTVHEVSYDAEVALSWMPKKGKAPVATATAKITDHKVDFSTPGVVVKEQTLEPPKQSKLADDVTITAELSTQLIGELSKQLFPALGLQGMRFVKAADGAKKPAAKRHFQVVALASGEAIDETARRRLTGELLAATGWNWDKMAVDLARVPYK